MTACQERMAHLTRAGNLWTPPKTASLPHLESRWNRARSHARTRYRIVSDPNEADAILTGAVTNYSAYPTISAGGRSTTVEAVVTLTITLTERTTGKVLFTRGSSEFRERYEISADPKAYFVKRVDSAVRVNRAQSGCLLTRAARARRKPR